jgi:hypothetical protein
MMEVHRDPGIAFRIDLPRMFIGTVLRLAMAEVRAEQTTGGVGPGPESRAPNRGSSVRLRAEREKDR